MEIYHIEWLILELKEAWRQNGFRHKSLMIGDVETQLCNENLALRSTLNSFIVENKKKTEELADKNDALKYYAKPIESWTDQRDTIRAREILAKYKNGEK